jgi:hypothetical protein
MELERRTEMIAVLRKRVMAALVSIGLISLITIQTAQGDQGLAKIVTLPNLTTSSSVQSLAFNSNPLALLSQNLSSLTISDASQFALIGKLDPFVQLSKTETGAQEIGKYLAQTQYNWGSSQYQCLVRLWDGESHWNYLSRNRFSGALGIAQANPPTKMLSAGADYKTNPVTQIRWGLSYIKARYGSPCNALNSHHWNGYY